MHRVIDGFVVQGGGYRYQPFVGPIDVVADAAIVNEYNVSNTRGTVAMAKIDPLPDSATNQWFVNLADNSANLDNNNGGFTVFANVLGEGMTVLDAIDALPYVSLGLKASEAPYFTETYSSPLDFVYINAEVVSRHSSAVHVYDSGLLISSINVDDGTLVSLNMNLTSTANGDVFEVNLESIIPIQTAPEGVATYSSADMRLRIPTLEANIDGGVQIVTNVVLIRTSPDSTSFSLESYDQ
ncbi:MAG: peptidylprolyl isomerase [SAR86 cluster bacterium]|uniref:Peptidylprolyl isomerase n=1 Tax=SAR86 cluster bacterium TaxID=2030880 RepID=A0A2A4MQ61_9GAMM|nr:MAG: peptidylprolyl isomerase [SAR86 cluster bacterium]